MIATTQNFFQSIGYKLNAMIGIKERHMIITTSIITGWAVVGIVITSLMTTFISMAVGVPGGIATWIVLLMGWMFPGAGFYGSLIGFSLFIYLVIVTPYSTIVLMQQWRQINRGDPVTNDELMAELQAIKARLEYKHD
jgi:hypothetical protein